MTKRLWRHVLMTSNLSCFGSFYFVFTLFRFKKRFMSPILCSISKIWISGWRSHGNIKLDKPRLIFPCDRQTSVHIFDMEYSGWHNLIICTVEPQLSGPHLSELFTYPDTCLGCLNRKWLTYPEIQLSGQSVWERRCPEVRIHCNY